MNRNMVFLLGVVLGWFLPRIVGKVRSMGAPKAAPVAGASGIRAA